MKLYVNQPVFPRKPDLSKKGYVRQLLGRIDRLKKMIILRKDKHLIEIQSGIDEVDKEIKKLELKRERLDSKRKFRKTEIENIQTEINEYKVKLKKFIDSGYISDSDLPSFSVRIKPSKRNGTVYEYYEGRVRGRMVNSRKKDDIYYKFGNYKKVRNIVFKEREIELPSNPTKINKRDLELLLEDILRNWWFEDLGSLEKL